MVKAVDVVVYAVEHVGESTQVSTFKGHVTLPAQTDDFPADLEAAHRQLDHLIKEARKSGD